MHISYGVQDLLSCELDDFIIKVSFLYKISIFRYIGLLDDFDKLRLGYLWILRHTNVAFQFENCVQAVVKLGEGAHVGELQHLVRGLIILAFRVNIKVQLRNILLQFGCHSALLLLLFPFGD